MLLIRIAKQRTLLDRYTRWRETAKILGLSKEAKRRLEWVIFYHQMAGENGTLVCRHFGLHRNTFGKWLKAFDEADLRSLETRSRKPHRLRYRMALPLSRRPPFAARARQLQPGRLVIPPAGMLYRPPPNHLVRGRFLFSSHPNWDD